MKKVFLIIFFGLLFNIKTVYAAPCQIRPACLDAVRFRCLRPEPEGGWCKTTPTPTPTPPPGTCSSFTDDFSGASINTAKWSVWVVPTGSSATALQSGGKIVETIPSGQTQYTASVVGTKSSWTGNFESVVDLKIDQSGSGSNATSGIIFANSNWQNQITLVLAKDGVLYGNTTVNNQNLGDGFSKSGLTQPVTVKISRVGNVAKFFYKSGNDFILLGQKSGVYSGEGGIFLHTNSMESFPAITASFDNFSLTCGLNPTATPTPPKCEMPPACLFTRPPCLRPEPIGGWCKVTPTPTIKPPSVTPIFATMTPTPVCIKSKGDANCDSVINGADYSYWLNRQCTTGCTVASLVADFNSDNKVNDDDYTIWLNNH